MTNPPTSAEQLYDLLPSIYRERDHQTDPVDPHLRRYLDSHGVLLDRVRGTLEQLYADHFPDLPAGGPACQDWIIPYLAELVGANPVSPFPNAQRQEVANQVRWTKRKGTLTAVEEIVEAVTQAEGELQEGWTRVARTPSIGAPLLSARIFGEPDRHPVDVIYQDGPADHPLTSVNPQTAARHPGLSVATIDLRRPSRAVRGEPGAPGVKESRFDGLRYIWPRDEDAAAYRPSVLVAWRQRFRHGVPCFLGSYEDLSPRTADLRTPDEAGRVGRYHHKRLIVYLPPPYGLCPPDPETVTLPGDWAANPIATDGSLEFGIDAEGRQILRNITAGSVVIEDDIVIDTEGIVRIERLRIDGTVTVRGGRLEVYRSAIRTVDIQPEAGATVEIDARDSLFGSIIGRACKVLLEYCTVLDSFQADAELWASEAILPDDLTVAALRCARYSRLPREFPTTRQNSTRNSHAKPLYLETEFCEPGCGVLRTDCDPTLLRGAEDGGEMGAYHAWRHHALREALMRKLNDFMPIGIDPVIVWDERLLCAPPAEGRP